jgi:hypothetical protein
MSFMGAVVGTILADLALVPLMYVSVLETGGITLESCSAGLRTSCRKASQQHGQLELKSDEGVGFTINRSIYPNQSRY